MAKAPPLILVDASSYLYRAYHIPQLQALHDAHGRPTGAIHGVLNMLRRLRREYDSPNIGVIFDAGGETFRHRMAPDYKANRPPMPETLAAQIDTLLTLLRAQGYPVLQVPGVEADDVIATLARRAADRGRRVIVSTGDKDLAQIVSDRITLVDTMSNTVLDPAGVRRKFGVEPAQIPDFLALVGDASDNIPGVPKVGPKTAAKWLAEFGDLETLLAHADRLPGVAGENLRAMADRLPLSKALARVDDGLELPVTPDDLRLGEPDRDTLRRLYRALDLRSWLEALEEDTPDGAPSAPALDPRCVRDEEEWRTWLARLEKAELFALDTETTGLDYMDAELVGLAFAAAPGEAAYLPLAHRDGGVQLDRERVLAQLRPLLESDRPRLVLHNAKYDLHILARCGLGLRALAHDTMLQSYVLDAASGRHDLDTLAKKHLAQDTIRYADVAGRGAAEKRFDEIDPEAAAAYAAEDADVTLRLHHCLWPRLCAEPELSRVYREIELPLVPVLQRMEAAGVLIDSAALAALSARFSEEMAAIEAEAHREAGEPFNLASPKQIQTLLYERLGLPVLRKTPKGQPSTAEDVLQELAERGHRLPALILQHRTLAKLKSTYTDKLPTLVHPRTGRLHTSYHQAVTATGRLSSSDPNLQNIPVRSEHGRAIRRAFVAADGHRLIAADYSQIELRIMAHLSGDAGLLEAFAAGEDIHRATAAEVFGVPREAVTPEQRRAAKAINFGLIYGMSAYGLARQLGIGRSEAERYIERYFERYPGVRRYMDEIRAQARERGFVQTVFGRRLALPEIHSRNPQRRQYAERTAINAPMQGSAADIIKRAMIAIDAWLLEAHPRARLIMQVHDELVLEVPEAEVEAVRQGVVARMAAAAELRVPLVVDAGVGRNWDEAH